MPRKTKSVVVTVPLTHAIEMYHRGFAEISTGEVKLTPEGRKVLGKSAKGAIIHIKGMLQNPNPGASASS